MIFLPKYLGGVLDGTGAYDDILEFQPATGTWSLVDSMMMKRFVHATAVIDMANVEQYCSDTPTTTTTATTPSTTGMGQTRPIIILELSHIKLLRHYDYWG